MRILRIAKIISMTTRMDWKLFGYCECEWEPIKKLVFQVFVWRISILPNKLLHVKEINLSICAHWLEKCIALNAGATLFTLTSDITFGEL